MAGPPSTPSTLQHHLYHKCLSGPRKVAGSIAALALVLVACTSGGTGAGEDFAQERQQLVVGAPEDKYVTEGPEANLGMYPINANVFETLIRMTPDFQIKPWLAESWKYLGDNTWRFRLRDGVTFHNGQPLTAKAVEFTFNRLAKGPGARFGIGPESTEVVDELTVDVTTTKPNMRLPAQLTHPELGIIAPGTEIGTNPTGTGPFQFVEYSKGERLVVERYEDYWGEQAHLERITFRFIPDGQTRWLSLKTGEVDLIYDLPRQLLPAAKGTPQVKLGITPPGASEIMDLNSHGKEPYTILQDRTVRRALAHAIDRKPIVDQVWFGSAQIGNTVTPAALLGKYVSVVQGPEYDPERARALLEQAGWTPGPDGIRVKDGRRLHLTMVNGYPPIDIRKPMPALVKAQLKKVGIELEIVETPEIGTYSDRLENGQGDIFLERVSQNDANPAFFAAAFWYSKADNSYSRWFSAGPEYDSLVEQALAAQSRQAAKKKTAQALHVAIDQQVVVVPVAAVYWVFAMNEEVEGFKLHGSARHVRWAPVHWGE